MEEVQFPATPSIEEARGLDVTETSCKDLCEVNKFAAVRINGMVERLQLPQQMKESVFCLLQNIFDQRISLIFNRHIDQIILCCFYGMAKISRMGLTFRKILYDYRAQPHCKQKVYRRVFVESGRQGEIGAGYVDIITFYNQVFVPAVRPLLLELGPVRIDHVEANNQA